MSDKKKTFDLAAAIDDGSLFSSDEVTKHTITMPSGDEADVFVLELPDKRFREILAKEGGYDRAEMIAATIRKPDGKALLTIAAAGKLKPKMARVLEEAAMKGNGFDKDATEKVGND